MSKLKCVVLDGWTLTENIPGDGAAPDEPTWLALSEGVDLTVYPRSPKQTVVDRLGDAALVLTNKVIIDREVMEHCPALRYIGVLATGTNVVDMAAAQQRGIVVTNVPGYATASVVEHVFALILELSTRAAEHARAVASGAWSAAPDFTFRLGPTVELAGRNLGIVGFGNIGRRVAAVAQAFGMRVLVASRTRHPEAGVNYLNLDDLFVESDVLTLHCPLSAETQQLVNARRLSLMRPGAILINTGRGGLIDELALARALADGKLRGAGLDVLSTEPPSPDHPLLKAPRCIITPHQAWATNAARQRLMDTVTQNVFAYLVGNPINRVA
jgi:glycerate dehydrogenase